MEVSIPPYLVIDLECSIKNRGEDAVGSMKASPFHPDNNIVMCGVKASCGERPSVATYPGRVPATPNKDEILVGQNIKFDLLYLLRYDHWKEWLRTGRIWDTMIVEYLLTGQQSKYASLDKLAMKYGGHVKDDKIKEYWDNDVDTEDIPKDELAAYLKGDVNNTELVFRKQYEKAIELSMLPLIESQMDAVLATTEMENNGMAFDIAKAYEFSQEINKSLEKYRQLVMGAMTDSGIEDPNPNSIDHMSLLFFGGRQKVRCDIQVYDDEGKPVRYKTGIRAGELKTRLEDRHITIEGLHQPKDEWKLKKPGFYATGDEVLKEIGGHLAKDVLQYRKISKDLNTYFLGYVKHYWPNDQCIHGSFSHCATNTGRLSSAKPNLQNLSGKTRD